MKNKEIRKWQTQEALKRFQMISPLLDSDIDEGKRLQLREDIAAKNGISKRSLYRYEEKYRNGEFEGLIPMNRAKEGVRSCRITLTRLLVKQSS